MKKHGLPTGSKGLTLIETLFAVLILASGIVFVSPAFFKAGGILSHLSCRYQAQLVMNNLIASKEENLRSAKSVDSRAVRGRVDAGGVVYSWELEISQRDVSGRFYLVTAHVAWRDFKENRLSKSSYILR